MQGHGRPRGDTGRVELRAIPLPPPSPVHIPIPVHVPVPTIPSSSPPFPAPSPPFPALSPPGCPDKGSPPGHQSAAALAVAPWLHGSSPRSAPQWVLPGPGPRSPGQAVGVRLGGSGGGRRAGGSAQPLQPAPAPLGSRLMIPRW